MPRGRSRTYFSLVLKVFGGLKSCFAGFGAVFSDQSPSALATMYLPHVALAMRVCPQCMLPTAPIHRAHSSAKPLQNLYLLIIAESL